MKEFSADRLREALRITEEADKKGLWNQSDWFVKWECGTAGCFAGNYAVSQKCEPYFSKVYDDYYEGVRSTSLIKTPDGSTVSTGSWAADELGLNMDESDRLFDGDNTMDELREIVDEIIAARDLEDALKELQEQEPA